MNAPTPQPKVALGLVALLWLGLAGWLGAAETQFSEIPRKATGLPHPTPASPAVGPETVSNTVVGPLTIGTNSMETLDDKHLLAIGDKLSFRIEEDQEEPKSLVVMDSGELETPYIGRFPAENKTCRQLAREIKAALERDYYYQATVIIAVDALAKSRGRVYVVGPIRLPGPVEIPSDEVLTVSKAILRAGGFTDFADRHNVKVTRGATSMGGEKKTFTVDVGQILDKGRTEKDLPLESGDLVVVPERLIRF